MWPTFTGGDLVFVENYAQSHHGIVIEALKQTEVSTCEVVNLALKYGATRRIPCQPRTVGNVIRISQNSTKGAYLILCEVEVYGTQGKIAIQLNCPAVYL